MSMDSVDDIEHAEDLLGGAGLLAGYCRLTCQAEEGDCGDEYCGCPCHGDYQTPTVPDRTIHRQSKRSDADRTELAHRTYRRAVETIKAARA